MKRIWITLAILLGGAVASAHGEYIRLVYTSQVDKSDSADDGRADGVPSLPGPMTRPGTTPPGRPSPTGGPVGKPVDKKEQPKKNPDEEFDPDSIRMDVVVEIKRFETTKNRLTFLHHRWGKTMLFPPNLIEDIRWVQVTENGASVKTVQEKYLKRKQDMLGREKKLTKPEDFLELADFGITHGMMAEFHENMGKRAELLPKDPIVLAYKNAKSIVQRQLIRDSATEAWKTRLGSGWKNDTTDHYSILFNGAEQVPDEVKDLGKQLEDNFQNYFYWFALEGRTIPAPERRLIVIRPKDANNFAEVHKAFESPPLIVDGFFAPREIVIVISPTTTDAGYESLSKTSEPLWQTKGWKRKALLEGEAKSGESFDEVAKAQVTALLLEARKEELERATATQLGSRQLAVATGLLPSAVQAPEWIMYGLGSLFETPKGAYWPGTGALHWTHLTEFKLIKDIDKLNHADVLNKVVTDSFFQPATGEPDDNDPIVQRGRTFSWSLTYFLAQKRQKDLMRYFDELAILPMDKKLDPDTKLFCFCQAFDLFEPKTDPARPDKISTKKMQALAKEWFVYMNHCILEVQEPFKLAKIREECLAKIEEEAKKVSPPPGKKPVVNPMIPR